MKIPWLLKLVILLLFLSVLPVMAQQKDIPLPDLPGQIAFIGLDFNVYATDFETENAYQLTEDASAIRRYEWVTWSRNGQLAYFCCNLRFASELDTSAYISVDGMSPGEEVFSGVAESIIYAAWSPGLCLGGTGCDALAMLINDIQSNTLRVDVARTGEDGIAIDTIANGNPFYFNWSPGGDQMIFHRMGRNIDFYDVNAANVLEDARQRSSGSFQSPAWSPVDDRVLFAVDAEEDGRSNLVISSAGENTVLRENVPGGLSFLWSPDGNYVAYRVFDQGRSGRLFVIDTITGDTVAESSLEGVLGFFWSPDSSRIAYLTLSSEEGNFNADSNIAPMMVSQPVQNATGLTWNILNVQTNIEQTLNTFIPTNEMIYLLTYFDQFAHSHQIWSPDSSHLVYSEIIELDEVSSEAVVTILDVLASDSVPLTIGHGVFAIWSFE